MTTVCPLCGLTVAVEKGRYTEHRKVIRARLERCVASSVAVYVAPVDDDVFADMAKHTRPLGPVGGKS